MADSLSKLLLPLTPRELEVLEKIADGKTSRKIADELGIGFKTVVTHRTNIMGKFGVNNVVSLVRRAISLGYIEP